MIRVRLPISLAAGALALAAAAIASAPIFLLAPHARAQTLRNRADHVTAYGDSLEPMDGGEREAVLALVLPVLADARAARDSTIMVSLASYQGSLLAGLGRTREAEAPLREALALAQALRDTVRMCGAHRQLAYVDDVQGRADNAAAHLQALVALGSSAGLPDQVLWGRLGLARATMRRGDPAAAKRELEEVLAEAKRLDRKRDQIAVLNLLGICRKNVGDIEGALVSWEECLALAREQGDERMVSSALTNLAAMEYYVGDPGSALVRQQELFETAWAGELFDLAMSLGANLVTMQTVLGRFADAESTVARILPVARREGWTSYETKTLTVLGMLQTAEERDELAVATFRRALALEGSRPIDSEVEAAVGLSDALASQGHLADALAVLRDREGALRSRLPPEVALTFDRALGLRLLENDRTREALAVFERLDRESEALGIGHHRVLALAKSAECLARMGDAGGALPKLEDAGRTWESERSVPLDPEWRAQRGENASLLATELAHAYLARDSTAVATAWAEAQRFKARTLEERMHGPGAPLSGFEPVALETLQRDVLLPGDLFVDFYLGPERSLAFVVTPRDVRFAWLPPDSVIEPRARLARELLLSGASPAATERASRELGELLLGAASDLLGDATRIAISWDGALNALPAAALAIRDPSTSAGAISLREKVTFVVPSAVFLARVRDEPAASSGRLLALHGTVGPDGAVLRGASDEVRHLATAFRGVEQSVPANGELPEIRLAGFDVLHLAAHTTVDDEHPWRSGFALTDAPLSAADIAGLDLDTRLAVLSGCESAGGRVLSGEGVQGLSSAFLAAGCRAVVATLWPVDDRVTARWMKAFYQELARGAPAAAALREAQEKLRADSRTAAPSHWAGFVLVGDGDVRVNLARRLDPVRVSLILVAVLGLFVSFTARRYAGRPQVTNAPRTR